MNSNGPTDFYSKFLYRILYQSNLQMLLLGNYSAIFYYLFLCHSPHNTFVLFRPVILIWCGINSLFTNILFVHPGVSINDNKESSLILEYDCAMATTSQKSRQGSHEVFSLVGGIASLANILFFRKISKNNLTFFESFLISIYRK